MADVWMFLLVLAALLALVAGFVAFMLWWLDYYAHQRQAR